MFLAELVVPPSTPCEKYIDGLGRYPPAPFTEKNRQTVFDTFPKYINHAHEYITLIEDNVTSEEIARINFVFWHKQH